MDLQTGVLQSPGRVTIIQRHHLRCFLDLPMFRSLNVHYLPELVSETAFSGATVVVIDVLRASTTITYALANGAREVIPCLEVEDARALHKKFVKGQAVLGGERGGKPIRGFDVGNSPSEYGPQVVGGQTVVFTTTNGTKALHRCRFASQVLIGSFVNLGAVRDALLDRETIHVLCAGTRGEISRDDVLCAGALIDRLVQTGSSMDMRPDQAWVWNDQAMIALNSWKYVRKKYRGQSETSFIATTLRNTSGGRSLTELGLEPDIDAASRVDQFDVIPRFDVAACKIVL